MSFHNLLDGVTWLIVDFSSTSAALLSVAFWLTIALAIAFFVGLFLTRKKGKEQLRRFLVIFGRTAVLYAVLVALLFTAFRFAEKGIAPQAFYPILVSLVLIIACVIIGIFWKGKIAKIVLITIPIVATIASLIFLGVYFAGGDAAEMNWLTNEDVNQIGLYVSAILLTLAIVGAGFIFDKGNNALNAKSISYAAVCIAMSFALSYLAPVKMPQGGSVTIAALLPLMLYSYMFGTKKGVFAGVVFGLLQAIQDPYILHPAQFLLDYPIAYSAIGLAGLFAGSERIKKVQIRFILGALIAYLGRFLGAFLSGAFAFGAFAPEGQGPLLYSFLYQISYIPADAAISILIGALILTSRSARSEVEKVRLLNSKKKPEPVAA